VIETLINGRWNLKLPEHRAARPQWVTGWEPERLASMYDLLEPGMTIVDCGAEEGDLTALYALWGCYVVPIEPNPRVWPNIRAIFEANGLRDQIAACFVGFAGHVTETRGTEPTVPPHIYPPCAFGPVIGDHGFCQLNERPDIARITIDDLAAEANLDMGAITIDSEGSELHVLQGAARTLRTAKPIVWVSVHPVFMSEQYGHTPKDLNDYMEAAGYVGELLAVDHEEHWLYLPA